MKNIPWIFLSIILFTSCKTLNEADLTIPVSNPILLPSLKLEYDINNLFIVYSYGKIQPTSSEKSTMDKRLLFKDLQIKNKPIVEDIIKLFESDVKSNINNSDTLPSGTIKLSLLKYKEKRNGLQVFLSIWTACGTCLLGIPITPVHTTLEIEVSVLDKKGNVLKNYIKTGHGLAHVAMYWGYGSDAWRKSNSLAFKNAMNSIKTSMKADYKFLNEELSGN